eukprot:7204387-Alexandrium_andersonii.AAC.1
MAGWLSVLISKATCSELASSESKLIGNFAFTAANRFSAQHDPPSGQGAMSNGSSLSGWSRGFQIRLPLNMTYGKKPDSQ